MGTRFREWTVGVSFLLIVLIQGASASAAIRQVCGSGCAYDSIQAAIDAASDGDVVRVANGTYVGPINFSGKAITVRSVNGPAVTTIDGGAQGSVVTFAGGEGHTSVLDGFTVTNGYSTGGGGIRCTGSSPSIRRCVVRGNTALYEGGGIYCQNASPLVESCAVSGNSADYGGGVYCRYSSSASMVNCTISGNRAGTLGGGIYDNIGSDIVVANCTISGNIAVDGGGLLAADSTATVLNSIIWGNAAVAGSNHQVLLLSGALSVSSSDVEGGWTGTGNINAAPLFVDPRNASAAPIAGGDYRIAAGSPCVDAGAHGGPSYDITGDPRPQGAGWDIGSDEFALLANGSFDEEATPVPPPWKGRALTSRDARDTSWVHGGFASFRMTGSTAAKQLFQTLAISGAAGDVFNLACWHKAYRPSVQGGLFGVTLTVFHRDRTQRTYRLAFPKRTHGWTKGQRAFTALKAFDRVRVSLTYANQTGRAWFDDVQLSVRR